MSRTKQLGIAFIRTSLVPPVAGFLMTWLVAKGIQINASWIYSLVTIALSGAYYVAFHLVEVFASNSTCRKWAGIFLGHPSSPIYLK